MKITDKVNENIKAGRQAAILDLIEREHVSTQNEMMDKLVAMGYNVTQATVSRDIRELRLVKTVAETGGYRYTASHEKQVHQALLKFRSIFSTSVVKIDYANNIVVINCHNGMAQAICECVDKMDYEGLLGTVAGDNTIMMVMRSEEAARHITEVLLSIR